MDIPENLYPFRDRQQDLVVGFCSYCGRELYTVCADICPYCFDAMKKEVEHARNLHKNQHQ